MPYPPYPLNRPHYLAHPLTTLMVPTWIHLPVPPTPPRTIAPFRTACVTPTGSPACRMPLLYSAANTPTSTPTIPATPLTDPATATRRSQNALGRSGTICLPPDLLTSLQDTIPDSIQVPQVRMDFVHVAQAHMQGAAACSKEILCSASMSICDAMHVIPLDPQAASTASASSRPHSYAASALATAAVGEIKSSPAMQAIDLTPATLHGALLRALHTNPVILCIDPAAEKHSAVFFVAWVDARCDAARTRCAYPTYLCHTCIHTHMGMARRQW
jgi:hypothetical protein